ncbi:MAG: protein jag [Verrucomicrobiales bacterium]
METSPKELLDTLLGYLGFIVTIEEVETDTGLLLQVYCGESERLIGPNGETLQETQYLLNRLLQIQNESSSKVTVDCEHYRTIQRDDLLSYIQTEAANVRQTGRPVGLKPLNSFDRRLVHNAFQEDPDIEVISPPGEQRFKSMTLRKKK